MIAARLDLPVIPVRIDGLDKVLHKTMKWPQTRARARRVRRADLTLTGEDYPALGEAGGGRRPASVGPRPRPQARENRPSHSALLGPWPKGTGLCHTCQDERTADLSKDDLIDVQGTVVAVHSGGLYRVQVDSGHEVLAQLSGRMRRFRIKVVPGDRVTVGVSPYDPVRGIITFRAR